MAGIPDPDRNTPANQLDDNEAITGGTEAEIAHRRMEHDAMNAAKRAGERMKKDEAGDDEFSNIGPV